MGGSGWVGDWMGGWGGWVGWLDLSPSPSSDRDSFIHPPTLQFPLWTLVALGAYALGNIGVNLMLFNSCPEAAVELGEDIRQAKVDLRKKGFVMDY